MIDKEIVIELLKSTTSKNLVGVGMELKPYNLALLMLQALNNSEEYGYVVMGVSKVIGSYAIEEISPETKTRAKEPIATALNLISLELETEYDNVNIDGKNIFVIKLKNSNGLLSMNFTKDLSSEDGFVKNLIIACTNLQARKLYSNASEDERNDYIGDILGALGYDLRDQTRRGSSLVGKSSGKLDLYINRDRLPFTIVEAMNLSSVNTNYINQHLDKIFLYDTSGNEFNVCLAYVNVSDFSSFWRKYSVHAMNHNYPAPILTSDTSIDNIYNRFSELKVMKTIHNRSNREVGLYHICVRIH